MPSPAKAAHASEADEEVFEDAEEFNDAETVLAGSSVSGVEEADTLKGAGRSVFADASELAFDSEEPLSENAGDRQKSENTRPKVGRKKQLSLENMDAKLAAAYRAPSLQTDFSNKFSFTTMNMGDHDFSLHRAVFAGDTDLVLELLGGMDAKAKVALDPQGNTALHVAVLRQKVSMVIALLDAGLPPTVQNARRWTPLDEAICLREKELVKLLHARETTMMKADLKAKKGDLLKTIAEIPDLSFQLKWELSSPVLGLLLRKYAPNDTYQVWKHGTKMRVDGSLMGLDDKRTSLIPQWKRGHFSLLFDGATTPATMLLCDHAKKKYIDLSKEKKLHKPSLDDEAAMIISEGAGKTKMRASEFRFKVVKTWFGNESTEKVEGWTTRIFEAAGKMMAVTVKKSPTKIPAEATFEDYLALQIPQDEVSEVPIDPYSMDSTSPVDKAATQPPAEGKKKRPKQARRLTGKCWMAENFPMSLKQLLPLLEVIGNANKHIARVGKFLQKYGDLSLFPVKLQVPLIYTVYALISFRQFKTMKEGVPLAEKSDDWYKLPEGYALKTFDDIAASRRSRRSASWDEAEVPPMSTKGSDAEILSQMGL